MDGLARDYKFISFRLLRGNRGVHHRDIVLDQRDSRGVDQQVVLVAGRVALEHREVLRLGDGVTDSLTVGAARTLDGVEHKLEGAVDVGDVELSLLAFAVVAGILVAERGDLGIIGVADEVGHGVPALDPLRLAEVADLIHGDGRRGNGRDLQAQLVSLTGSQNVLSVAGPDDHALSALALQIKDLTGDVGVADVDGFGIDSHAGILAGGFDDFHSAGAELVVRVHDTDGLDLELIDDELRGAGGHQVVVCTDEEAVLVVQLKELGVGAEAEEGETMILTVNIGNTHITIAGYEHDTLQFSGRLHSSPAATVDEYAMNLLNLLSLYQVAPERIEGGILGSVVPALTGRVLAALRMLCSARFLTVGPGLKSGIKLRLDNPAQLGAELLCGAVAALAETPGPLAVISADTAISIMAVNEKQELVGGVILPGPQLSQAALVQKTAQLPQIDLSAPASASILGKNTAACLQNGFVLGTASLLDGLAERFRAELGPELKFYATGNLPRTIREACHTNILYRETLITDGLYRIWQKNRKG